MVLTSDVFSSAWMVAGTMAEILLVVLVGAMGAHFGIIPSHMRAELSKLCLNLLLPPFLFIKLSKAVSLSLLFEWWMIPLFVVLNLIFGLAIGLALERVLKRHVQSFAGTFLVACGVGNAGTVPMAIMYSVCDQGLEQFGDRDGSCSDDAMAMISLGVAVAAGFFWTFGPGLLKSRNKVEQDLEGHGYKEMEETQEERAEGKANGHAAPTYSEAQLGNNTAQPPSPEHCQPNAAVIALPFSPCMHLQPQLTLSGAQRDHPVSPPTPRTRWHAIGCLKGAKAFLNSASMAVLCGLFCGCIPPIKHLLHGEHAPLHIVTAAMESIGSATIPLMLLVLGANLVSSGQQGGAARLSPLIAFSVSAVRLILLPLIGMALVHLLKGASLLGSDPLMHFVLLVQFTTPSAMNLVALVSIFGSEDEMRLAAQLALYQYLFATPLLSAALIAYTTIEL